MNMVGRSKVGWGKAPTINRNRCGCFNNDSIEYISSCRQSNIYIYPTLWKSILHKDTKHNLKFYFLKIATKRATCPISGARRPSGWGKMLFQYSLNNYKYAS